LRKGPGCQSGKVAKLQGAGCRPRLLEAQQPCSLCHWYHELPMAHRKNSTGITRRRCLISNLVPNGTLLLSRTFRTMRAERPVKHYCTDSLNVKGTCSRAGRISHTLSLVTRWRWTRAPGVAALLACSSCSLGPARGNARLGTPIALAQLKPRTARGWDLLADACSSSCNDACFGAKVLQTVGYGTLHSVN
jgi:hypothetical protein